MSTGPNTAYGANIVNRIERIPFSSWHAKMVSVVGTATFFDAFDALAIAYIMPVLIPLWHIKPSAIGFLISVGYIGQLIGALFFGWLAERVGRKRVLIACAIVLGVFAVVSAFSWGYWSLFVFRFLQGIGLGGEVPVAASYISEWSKAKGRGRFFFLYEMLFNVGLVVVALLGYLLVPSLGWQSMLIIGAIPAIVVPIFLSRFPESPRWLAAHGRGEEAGSILSRVEKIVSKNGQRPLPEPAVAVQLVEERATNWGELFKGIYAKRTPLVWLLWFCVYFVNYGMATWLPSLYTSVFKVTVQTALLYSLITAFCGLLADFVWATIIDKTGRKPWLIVSFIGSTLALGILWLTGVSTPALLLIFTSINMVFIGPLSLGMYLYSAELYPTRMRALGNGAGTGWLRIASIIGPSVVGAVVGGGGSLKSMIGIFAVVAFVGLIVSLFATETKNRVLEEVSP